MLTPKEEEHYSRQMILPALGKSGQIRLKNASVAVVGAGGLGCPALSYLAGAGIGQITIIDGDIISASNLHRQLLFGIEDVGKSKALTAKNKLIENNPYPKIQTVEEYLTVENAESILKNHDVIIDCTDNYATRYLINDVCFLLKKPMIYGAIHRFEGQISVFNYKTGPTYRCLFPLAPSPESQQNCAEAGVLGIIPGLIGMLQATEAIKIITGIGEVLSGSVLFYDALNQSFNKIGLQRSAEQTLRSIYTNGELNPELYKQTFCVSSGLETTIDEIDFSNLSQYQWIDVREKGEEPIVPEGLSIEHIPLSALKENHHLIDGERIIILFCQSGIRSLSAAETLQKEGFTSSKSLKEGISKQLITLWKQHLTSYSLKAQ